MHFAIKRKTCLQAQGSQGVKASQTDSACPLTRPTRKETILGRNGGMALNTTFNVGWDQQQQMPTQMPQLPTQSPQANSVRRMETPTPMLPPGPHRPLTPRMPLPTSPASSSQP